MNLSIFDSLMTDQIYHVLLLIAKFAWPCIFYVAVVYSRSFWSAETHDLIESKDMSCLYAIGRAAMLCFIPIMILLIFCDLFYDPASLKYDSFRSFVVYIRTACGATVRSYLGNHGVLKTIGYLAYCIISAFVGGNLIVALVDRTGR